MMGNGTDESAVAPQPSEVDVPSHHSLRPETITNSLHPPMAPVAEGARRKDGGGEVLEKER